MATKEPRRSRGEVDILVQRIKVEGWIDVDFQSKWEDYEQYRSTRIRDSGYLKAAHVLATLKGRLPEQRFTIRVFRDREEPRSGGVLVVATAERAEEVFAGYAEGFYS